MSSDTAAVTTRGQVGVGTLIVFIAMVLVAAVAAGVLINTAGFLQEAGEDAGDETQSEVTDRIDVSSASGALENVNGERGVVTATITVNPQAGAGPIDLDELTIDYFDAEGGISETVVSEDVALEGDTADGVSAFTVEGIVGVGDNNVLTDRSDTAEITLSFAANDGDFPVGEDNYALFGNDDATLTFQTATGGETTISLDVPSKVQEQEDLERVQLS